MIHPYSSTVDNLTAHISIRILYAELIIISAGVPSFKRICYSAYCLYYSKPVFHLKTECCFIIIKATEIKQSKGSA